MLIGILKNIEAGNRNPSKGICGNVQEVLNRTHEGAKALQDWVYVLNYIVLQWPEHSGFIEYPVPLKLLWVFPADPKVGYDSTFNKWTGQYGRARKRLLRFIIEELEKREKSL